MKASRILFAIAALALATPVAAQSLGIGLDVIARRPIHTVVNPTITGLDFSLAKNSQYLPLF